MRYSTWKNLWIKIQVKYCEQWKKSTEWKIQARFLRLHKELPYHRYNWTGRHVLHQTWEEFLVLQLFIMLFKKLCTCLNRHKITINVPFAKIMQWLQGIRNISYHGTCMNFMATSLNPFCSNLLMISAMRPLWTASGLSMRNVRSSLSAILRTYLLATVPEQATDFRRQFLEGRRMSRHVGWAFIVHIRKYTFLGEGRVVVRSSFSQTGWAAKLRRARKALVRRQSNNLVITTNFSHILKRLTEICA